MPIIRIDYDNEVVSDEEILNLSKILEKIVGDTTNLQGEVIVYANYPHIKLKIFPIEVFIEMSANKISDRKKLIGEIKAHLKDWKVQTGFKHLINLTLIPMDWDMEFDI